MKTVLYWTVAISLALAACKKSAHTVYDQRIVGDWQLVKKYSTIGAGQYIYTPAADSGVLLTLHANGTYAAGLNGTMVSQGGYSITPDTSDLVLQTLELNNFQQTGIFAPFKIVEFGAPNQPSILFDGFFAKLDSDTLTLYTVSTPGGESIYTFVKNGVTASPQ
jgi:hypothetical protein